MAERQNLGMRDYESLADVTSQGDQTAVYYFDMEGYSFASIQFMGTAGTAGTNTLTVHATNQDASDRTTADYIDVTNAWFGAASFTASTLLERDTPASVKFVKVQVARTSDGGNTDGAWKVDVFTKNY